MASSLVIVDAYSSGSLYAPAARDSDRYQYLRRVHVQSTADPPSFLIKSFVAEDFDRRIVHTGDLKQTLDAVLADGPAAIIPGTETGVELADALATLTGTPSNGVTRSSARRNKYQMIEAVRSAGLNVADQMATDSLLLLLNWVESHGLDRVVLKPLRSAGLDHVIFCQTRDDIRTAFGTIFGERNKLGEINTAVLAQSVLEGNEYIVDTVSSAGRHHVTDIWRYKRSTANGRTVYDRGDLLRGSGPIERRLSQYVFRVLDTLGIRYGPAHAEVMLTGAGPVLVEIGARPCGAGVPRVCRRCVGYSQIDLGLDAYLAPAEFLEATRLPYHARELAMGMYFISNKEGRIEAAPGLDRVAALPDHFRTAALGKRDQLQKTVDMITSPGIVEFVHTDETVLDERHRQVRELETAHDFWITSHGEDMPSAGEARGT
jgi:biotin carboxylase